MTGSTSIGTGNLVFGDGTVLNSANIAYSSVAGLPVYLSQFTNNLPIPANTLIGVSTSAIGGTGNPNLSLNYDANNKLILSISLTNCYCNC